MLFCTKKKSKGYFDLKQFNNINVFLENFKFISFFAITFLMLVQKITLSKSVMKNKSWEKNCLKIAMSC